MLQLFDRKILLRLLRLALPMMVSHGAFALMIFTDRYFMAQLSSLHIAAALGGGVASYSSIALFSGIIAYGNAMVAQYLGAEEKSKCSLVVTQGIIIVLLCLPLLILISFAVAKLFTVIGHDPQQVILERDYYLVLMAGSFFTLSKTVLASFFAGIGKTPVVMMCDVSGVLLNIPLSYCLVFGALGLPELGLIGAGIGTLVATLFSLLLFLGFYFSREIRNQFSVLLSFCFSGAILRRYLRLGVPSGLETFLNFVTFNLFLLLFQSYGVVESVSIAIVFNWDMLCFIPMIGINIAVMTEMGRLVGSGDLRQANKVIASGFIIAVSYSGSLALCFILFRFSLVDIFQTSDGYFPDIRILTAAMMIGLATYVIADASSLVAGGALRGAGDTRWLMIASISLHWLMLLAQFFIIRVFNFGPLVSWWSFAAMLLLLAAVFVGRLFSGKWRQPTRLARVMAE